MTNPLTSRFWSSVPYKLGAAAVKYSAKPCAGIVAAGKSGSVAGLSARGDGRVRCGTARRASTSWCSFKPIP